jgi:hypothetical protein
MGNSLADSESSDHCRSRTVAQSASAGPCASHAHLFDMVCGQLGHRVSHHSKSTLTLIPIPLSTCCGQ